ncbi:MAG: ribokinase, partial [Yersinia sp. (in: enterobacteria)]
ILKAMKMASAFAAYSVTGKGTQRSYPDAPQFIDFLKTLHQGK